MIKTVDQTTVAEIFSINNDKIYKILRLPIPEMGFAP